MKTWMRWIVAADSRPRRTLARSPARRRLERAYTAVEVLMSLAVLAVGVTGIIATDKVTLAANVHAKNLAIATRIGQSWLGMLEAEAALWGSNGSMTRTIWLQQVASTGDWFRPAFDDNLDFGPAFDALGNPVSNLNQDPNAKFCVDLRLARLTANANGGALVRSEVRVIWLRDSRALGDSVVAAHACSIAEGAVDDAEESRLFHFVFMSGGVRQVGT